ncbi:FtsQ-type POTRA domain-containing protein [bacterium]|nr:FtsQ-type POTRA domain-containing protein [bacterium]
MSIQRMPKVIPGYRSSKKTEIPWKKIFLVIFFVAIISALFYLFLLSPVFVIKEIEIGHTAGVEKKEIEEIAKSEALGKNIFLWQGQNLKDQILSKNPLVLEVLIFKGLPHTVKIVLQETTPIMNWETGGKTFLLGEKGRVIKEGKNSKLLRVKDNKNLPVAIGRKIIPYSFGEFLLSFQKEAKEKGIKIDHFEINESLFDLWAFTDNGIALIVSPTRSPQEMLSQFIRAKEMIAPTEYIDLRFSHRVFVK